MSEDCNKCFQELPNLSCLNCCFFIDKNTKTKRRQCYHEYDKQKLQILLIDKLEQEMDRHPFRLIVAKIISISRPTDRPSAAHASHTANTLCVIQVHPLFIILNDVWCLVWLQLTPAVH